MLGEGSLILHHAACTLDALRDRLTAYGAGFFETEERSRPYDELDLLGQDMDALSEYLAAEVGSEHGAVAALASARAVLGDIALDLGRLKDRDAGEVIDVRKLAEQVIAQVARDRARFDACRNHFMEAKRGGGQRP